METSKRVVGMIEDLARWIKNWLIYAVILAFLVVGCFYISGLAFQKWHYGKFETSFKYNIKTILYETGWLTLVKNHDNSCSTRYQPYLDSYRKQIDQSIAACIAQNPGADSECSDGYNAYYDKYAEQVNQQVDACEVKNPLGKGFATELLISTFTPLVFLGFLFFLLRAPIKDFRPFDKDEKLHGDARWATEKDVSKAGLRAKTGLIIGKDSRGFLVAPGFQHALLFAPTGSGKGVGCVIPNLLFWEDSLFVHDIKLENYELTSGYRQEVMKHRCYLWNPASPDGLTHCYNPFDWVSKKPGQMVDDVQKIANLILPEQEFWNNEARSLFVGVSLYLQAVPEKTKSFGEVVRTLRSDDVVYNLAVVLDTIGKKIHPVAYMNIAAFLQKADKERSGVISTLNSGLELWANPLIDTATASSDFNIGKMKQVKTSVFVGLTPDNIQRLQPLLQVFYQQATEFLARKIPDKKLDPYGVLFLMDEFPTLGEMKQFHAGIAYFRGYNVRLLLIVQDTQQLKGIYEEHGMNTFLSNSTYRITYAANNVETANLISQLIGNKTVKQRSYNKPKFLDFNPATRTIHESEIQRALLLPQEVIGLPRDEQIILIESTPPIRTKKIFYYNDRFFTPRLLDPIEVPIQEPYDPNKFRAKKKGETDSDAKKDEKKPSAPPPPLPDFPDDKAGDGLPDFPDFPTDNKS